MALSSTPALLVIAFLGGLTFIPLDRASSFTFRSILSKLATLSGLSLLSKD